VGDALYLVCEDGETIMRYKFAGKRGLSLIEPPDVYEEGVVLMTVEDGGLGIAGLDMSTLYLWSLKTDPGGVSGWKTRGDIKLQMLPIGDPRSWRYLIGFAKGCTSDIVFVSTDAGVFTIDLKSEQATKVCENRRFTVIFPYTSFCTPGSVLKPTKFYLVDVCEYSMRYLYLIIKGKELLVGPSIIVPGFGINYIMCHRQVKIPFHTLGLYSVFFLPP
jgi:hypothetical protein